jgi:hypothetical protein
MKRLKLIQTTQGALEPKRPRDKAMFEHCCGGDFAISTEFLPTFARVAAAHGYRVVVEAE